MAAGGGGGGHGPGLPQLYSFINLSILLLIIFFAVRGPLQLFLRNRADTIRNMMEDAEEASGTARKAYDEVSVKLKNVQQEGGGLVEKYKAEAERISTEVMADAEKNATSIIENTKEYMQVEMEAAKKDLIKSVLAETVEKAEKELSDTMDNKNNDSFILEKMS